MNWQTDFLAAHPCLTHLTLCKVNFCWLQILLNNHTANRLPPVSLVCCTNSWRLQACLSCLWPHTSNRSLRKSQENTVKENTVTVASWRTVENRGEPWRTVKASNGLEMFSAKLCSFCISSTLKTLTMSHSNHEQSNYKGREKMAKAQFVKSHRPRKSAGNFQEQRGPHHSQVKCIRHVHTCSRFAQVYQSSTWSAKVGQQHISKSSLAWTGTIDDLKQCIGWPAF